MQINDTLRKRARSHIDQKFALVFGFPKAAEDATVQIIKTLSRL